LIKIDSHKIEYLLINLFIAVQSMILQTKQYHEEMGVKLDDLIGNIQHFSEGVMPAYRKKREYLRSILAKHELDSQNPYNKKSLNGSAGDITCLIRSCRFCTTESGCR